MVLVATYMCVGKKGPNMSRRGIRAAACQNIEPQYLSSPTGCIYIYIGERYIQRGGTPKPFTQYLRPLSLATAPSPIQGRRAEQYSWIKANSNLQQNVAM